MSPDNHPMQTVQLPSTHARDPGQTVPDPYRVFFPLGVMMGITGVAIWPIYALGWIETVSGVWHIDLQLQGFLFAYVLGFLLTALPRFLGGMHATWGELGVFTLLYVVGNLCTALGHPAFGRVAFFLCISGLGVFAARRFRVRRSNPPPQFVLVGSGLLLGWLASLVRVVGIFVDIGPTLEIAARRLISEGMVTFLVFGIGAILAPMFWGFAGGPQIVSALGAPRLFTRQHKIFLAIAGTLALSFLLEHGLNWTTAALWTRAFVASFVFLKLFQVHRRPVRGGVLSYTLWMASWAVLTSFWGTAIHPAYRVEVLHVLFVGGFGLMSLAIATRVTLSHGGYPLEIEARSKSLALSALLLLVALVLRVGAFFFPERYFEILGWAGVLWMAGIALWGMVFATKAIVLKSEPTPPLR